MVKSNSSHITIQCYPTNVPISFDLASTTQSLCLWGVNWKKVDNLSEIVLETSNKFIKMLFKSNKSVFKNQIQL